MRPPATRQSPLFLPAIDQGKLQVTHRDVELAELRQRIARLTEEARRNEETWKRSQRREMALLEAESLPDLFGHLTTGVRGSFRLQAASVAIADPEHEIRNLLLGLGQVPDAFGHVLLVDTVDYLTPQHRRRFRPWLGPFRESSHGHLFATSAPLASVALLPLIRKTEVIGSLHLGSSDPGRFTPAHATDFLHHLACMAAFGLDSAVNRARLVQRHYTDALTGWHNRGYLETRLGEELGRSQREDTSLVCLMIDVDYFKRVNDEHGHQAGDAVLREAAQRIGAEVRSSDISARYGGEEFIVLLPHTNAEAGHRLAERIRAAVSAEPFGNGVLAEPLPVTVSIGRVSPGRHSGRPGQRRAASGGGCRQGAL